MALIYFAVTLFVSAFLLFLVQPMIGKMILPRLGGTPQVWNTCMMFFQTTLLFGYFYTHYVTSKLPLKKQLLTHCLVLLAPFPVLLAFGRPFYVASFGAEGGGNPIFVTLALLAVIVGIPFLVVSTTAPLLQRWFNHTGHPAAKDPYFLYGASNAGSILGLIMYPVGVEYLLGLDAQAWFWLCGYVVLAILVGGCALMVVKAPETVQLPGATNIPEEEPALPEMPMPPEGPSVAVTATPPAPAPAPSVSRATGIKRGGKQRGGRGGRGPTIPSTIKSPQISIKKPAQEPIEEERPFEMTPLRRLRWVGLAAVPASLMLGCTTYISTDISPVPLLWVIPLTLYLLSFVLVFLRWPVPWVGVGRNPRELTPHKVMVILQLAAVALLIFTLMRGGFQPLMAMATCWGAFFLTALVCHGELARDRPPPQYLTEFYLWMSVGGMLGGTFNALIAPLVPWWGLFEFPLALVFAGWVRPPGKGATWTDRLFENMPKEQAATSKYILDIVLAGVLLLFAWLLIRQASDFDAWNWRRLADPRAEANATEINMQNPLFKLTHKMLGANAATAYTWANFLSLLLTFGLPIGLALLTWKRPLRLALCLGAVLLANALYEVGADDRTLYRDRSYFGLLRVIEDKREIRGEGNKERITVMRYTYLMHGTTHHGLNFHLPDGTVEIPSNTGSKKLPDMRRLATTYYHRDGPVGAVMEKINWFPGLKSTTEDNRLSYWADARLPASVIGSGVPGLGVNLPIAQLVSVWSEPAYATIGLGTGTMASYSRPYQHLTFYEIDEHIRNFSLPPEDRETYFTYLQGSLKRGTKLEVIMGDARLTMTKEGENKNGTYYVSDFEAARDRKKPLKWDTFTSTQKRESYYRAMEVDAFSSDAIPVHLITREAIEMYMDKLMPNGVLLVHTSNRHVNLVRPVMKICEEVTINDYDSPRDEQGNWKKKTTPLAWVICKDDGVKDSRNFNVEEPSKSGHFGSEYVLVARKQEYLPPYAFTPEQIKIYEEKNIYFPIDNVTKKQFQEINDKRLEQKKEKLPFIESTITYLTPGNIGDGKYRETVEYFGYSVPAGFRTWTDDYSNVLSVFRWR